MKKEAIDSHETFLFNFDENSPEYINRNKDNELNNDSTSFNYESLISNSFETDSDSTINKSQDCEIEVYPFSWEKTEFEKAHSMINTNENNKPTWEDINEENSDMNLLSIPEIESIESMEGNTYLIENTFGQSLTSCVLLDMIDGHIQYCSNKTDRQRPLAQLVGT
ncbi:18525_t:CDS:1 [Acaulospora morrowiae]|uniref:18525_t:CDS:1 n=1 Tax=Acaulospora morrowiae TaxID=94023 RepID=A0A9N9F737_9GLOM|nr:18525_t:CDS:1 [Acaulospora morrowiae]